MFDFPNKLVLVSVNKTSEQHSLFSPQLTQTKSNPLFSCNLWFVTGYYSLSTKVGTCFVALRVTLCDVILKKNFM